MIYSLKISILLCIIVLSPVDTQAIKQELPSSECIAISELNQDVLIAQVEKIVRTMSKEDFQTLLESFEQEQTMFGLSEIGYSLGMTFCLVFIAFSIVLCLDTFPNFFNPPIDAVTRRVFNRSIHFTGPVNEHVPWSYLKKD